MSERVSLDQLLAESGSEPGGAAPRRPRWWLRDPLVAVAAGVAGYVVLRVFGFVVPFPVLVCTVLAVLMLRRVMAAVPVGDPPAGLHSPAWGVVDESPGTSPPLDGVVRAVQRWEARFAWTERDHARWATAVRARLVDLVDERLRHRHGLTLRGDPARAREVIGDELWTFLHAPVRRGPSPQDMATIIAEMEKI
jgi:hypothetical protein